MPTHPGANRPDMIKAKRHGHVLFRLLNPLFTHCGPSRPEGFDPLQGTARTYMFSSWMTSGRLCNGAQVTVAAILQAHQLVGLLAAMFADPAPAVHPMYRQPLAMRVSRNLSSSFSGWERALRLAVVVPAGPFSIRAAAARAVKWRVSVGGVYKDIRVDGEHYRPSIA
jgi:hypothetical protein